MPPFLTIFCPDCGRDVRVPDQEAFVEHREHEHPPSARVVVAEGIESQTRFGTDPPEEH